MPKLARLPANDLAPDQSRADVRRIRRYRHRYYAFLSYSHDDEEIADWLHDELEGFRVPHSLQGRLTENGTVPKRLTPIFRDRHELAAADDLTEEIEAALASSQFLIVLCSPAAAASHWTNVEIETFKRSRPDGCVFAAIVAGEPFASDVAGHEAEECFPPALRQKYDRRGRPTGKRAEPLAADLREQGDGRRTGFLKLVAGMLGVGLDELVQRETMRRQRRLGYLLAASLGGMAVTSTLAITAIQARDAARDQRREAEGLIGFMLGDLKDKLEPIGKLDALDGVGSRVLAYYQKQNKAELSDAALSQRSRALSLMGQVAYARGDLDTSERLYREAMMGTAEAVRRKPDDPQRLFDQAQNVYWIGDIAMRRGNLAAAETSHREYSRLATRMVALAPDNMKWRMETQYAEVDLGIVLLRQRRFAEASAQFAQALRTIEALATADPRNRDYQQYLAESVAWLADGEADQGHLDRAISLRERHVALLDRMAAESHGDVVYREALVHAHRGLGNLYASRGRTDLAMQHFNAAVEVGTALVTAEPHNSNWLGALASSQLGLAAYLLDLGRKDAAAPPTDFGCDVFGRLVRLEPAIPGWRQGLRGCLANRARLALASGATDQALGFTKQMVAVARSIRSPDPPADSFAVARALRLQGDVYRAQGSVAAAHDAWLQASKALPRAPAELPDEMNEHRLILQRLGRQADANALAARLAAIGYHRLS